MQDLTKSSDAWMGKIIPRFVYKSISKDISMQLMTGVMQAYDWGSTSLIANLQGRETASEEPEAEIWYGAHPVAPSLVGSTSLDQLIQDDPLSALGQRISGKFNKKLPFLLKVLAAGAPLSLQAHPSLEQAQDGFERENSLGIDLKALNRNYRDANHKPELIVALTEFVAIAGFRPLSRTLEIFSALNCAPLNEYREFIVLKTEEESLKTLFDSWISLSSEARKHMVDSLIPSAQFYLANGEDMDIKFVLDIMLSLFEKHPDDNGVLVSLLLNFYKLSPGEGIYLDAGNLHSYVSGLAVEIMANSDNVLRGGLTSKHVDVPELNRVLRFEPLKDARVRAQGNNEVVSYPVPIDEFKLDKVTLHGTFCAEQDGPMIILCTKGNVKLSCGNEKLALSSTEAAWVPASDGYVLIDCNDAEVFVARA